MIVLLPNKRTGINGNKTNKLPPKSIVGGSLFYSNCSLFNRHAFGEVSGLIDIQATNGSDMIR